MSYIKEFPDFDPSTMPTIPASWEDTSWHNYACPSFQFGQFLIYVDYEDIAKREFAELEDAPRFAVGNDEDGLVLFQTDEWHKVLEFIHAAK